MYNKTWRRALDRLIYGEERLGHQTQIINEHVHRAMVCICGATLAIAGLLGVLMLYLVYLAMHVGEPARPRAAIETSSTTTALPMYTKHHPGRYTTAVPAGTPGKRCTDHLLAPLRSNCTPINDEVVVPPLWFFDPIARRCRKWTNVCVRPAFTSQEACTRRCHLERRYNRG
ncbi:uncharacterized protein LOC142765147 [Rhipicephalus microplus]|uniref:uncharacterized protein LOC142765147 n=1 Tax=Rhipicephalus microplus TaxID=6941 RepID=UPI003F6B6C27